MEINFPKIEEKILKFWKQNKIFERSIKQRAKSPNFVFYEGPPTVNAKPGLHHVLARIYKDIICRYQTMRGFKVLRKAGWDTHGLPVELEVEKELGLKRKKDIEKYGIARFNQRCRKSVFECKEAWEKLTERIAFWLNMGNPYITCQTDYMETVWQIIKQIWKKGLLYQDYKVTAYCPRCGTSLSSHEVALGYKRIKEPSIYVKFKLKSSEFKNTSLLVWTTTPWTLPGNVAVAVNPQFTYAKVKIGGELFILAKERLNVLGKEYIILEEFKGKDLIGLEYEPLFLFYDHRLEYEKKTWRVVEGDFVSLEEGTGLVHIAPAFGEEDLQVAKENNLPILLNVDLEGKFKSGVKFWAGLYVKDADPGIIRNLKDRKLLFKQEEYEHDYPFCWRCDSPLLYYAKQSWFVAMTRVKNELIKNNQKINWVPAHLKRGRFGEWLREVKDWTLSRERYWGTPLPIWRCQKCANLEVIGSKKDLMAQKFSQNSYFILRHGESLRSKKKIASCWPEKVHCPLTREGKKQIQRAALELKDKKIDIIFASDLLRIRQTAQIVAKQLGIKVKFDKRIREVNVGIYNARPLKLARKAWGEPLQRFKKKLPGGESYSEVKKRMYNFLKDIDAKYQGKNILIVSHECPLSLLEGAVKGFSNQEIVSYRGGEEKIKVGEWRPIEFKALPYDQNMNLDFHRPYIDKVNLRCPKCDSISWKVPEVIDCWFDAGSMPFAQWHWPFENKALIDKRQQFPADYIAEAIDQTRGWFYTLLAISTVLGKGVPYKNVISVGHFLDSKGEKMSKSKGNVVDPWPLFEKYGADSIRWRFYTVNQPGEEKLFLERDLEQALKKFILTFWNSFQFFQIYAVKFPLSQKISQPKNVLDRWIISKLNSLIQEVTVLLEKYDVTKAGRLIEDFMIDSLSLWYIRRSRIRFQKPGTKTELKQASQTLSFVLLTLTKLTAPFIPFLSEEIYQGLKVKSSVHLEDWPKVNKKLIDKNLEQKMGKIREIVAQALAERARAGIKVRQPLSKLQITNYKLKKEKELLDLVKDEVNVKQITFGKSLKLNTKITPELKKEGIAREVIRQIQEIRKKAGLKPKQKILVRYFGTPELNKILEKNKKFILSQAQAKDFSLSKKPLGEEVKIDQQSLWLAVKRL